jgi:hypothetical protein
VTTSIIDDLAAKRHLGEVLGMARNGPIPLERLQTIAFGAAARPDIEAFGEMWVSALIDLLQRARIGALVRDADGQLWLVPMRNLPSTPEEAWARVVSGWPRAVGQSNGNG